MTWNDIEKKIVEKTESLLTWRKRRRLRKKEKQKRKNQIVDWVQAFLWAACVVLVINQYFVQAYAIPTGSMEDTIIGDDRIFVDKFSYGPELVPGALKMPGIVNPQRGEIVVFTNPDYHEEMKREVSPVEELVNRLLYMLTFTFINNDKTPDGEVAHHFLVKRLIGIPEDQLRMRGGRVEIKGNYEDGWTPEDQIQKNRIKRNYKLQKKLFPFDKYDMIKNHAIMQTKLQNGIPVDSSQADLDDQYARLITVVMLRPGEVLDEVSAAEIDIRYKFLCLHQAEVKNVAQMSRDAIESEYKKLMLRKYATKNLDLSKMVPGDIDREFKKMILEKNLVPDKTIDKMSPEALDAAYQAAPVKYLYNYFQYRDDYYEDYWSSRTACSLKPYFSVSRNRFGKRELGWYIPEGRFFPMGDNRDNSKDARSFNSVETNKALGRSMFRFWPIPRIGGIE